MMALEGEELVEPASPGAQYLNTSKFATFSVLCIMESEIPIHDSSIFAFAENLLVPSSPRFSSIMVPGKNGSKNWKRVEVNIEDHVIFPSFQSGKSPDYYNEQLANYLSSISVENFSQSRPPWEIHIFNYPTSNAAGTIIFKFHHTIGDGYTLTGVLLSSVQRLDDPSLPLTFPPLQTKLPKTNDNFIKMVPQILRRIMNTIPDFGRNFLRSTLIEDDVTPIRSGHEGLELMPFDINTITFLLDSIKHIKSILKVTINDVITGIIMFASRLYMQHGKHKSISANSTALVLLNTRNTGGGYKSVNEMLNSNAKVPSGNHFAFLDAAIPELSGSESSNPISFILEAHKMINKKRNSTGTYFTAKLLEILGKIKGPEATAQYVHGKLKNTSLTISNMIGPTDQMALGGHPIKGFYFYLCGVPQSIVILVLSYMGKLTLTRGTEKGFIDANKFKKCIENAFEMALKAVMEKGK